MSGLGHCRHQSGEACRPLGANGGQIVQQAAAAVAAGQFTAYKLRFQVVAMGAVYAWLVVAAVADPAVVANGTAVVAKKLLDLCLAARSMAALSSSMGNPFSGPRKLSAASWCPCWRLQFARCCWVLGGRSEL